MEVVMLDELECETGSIIGNASTVAQMGDDWAACIICLFWLLLLVGAAKASLPPCLLLHKRGLTAALRLLHHTDDNDFTSLATSIVRFVTSGRTNLLVRGNSTM